MADLANLGERRLNAQGACVAINSVYIELKAIMICIFTQVSHSFRWLIIFMGRS